MDSSLLLHYILPWLGLPFPGQTSPVEKCSHTDFFAKCVAEKYNTEKPWATTTKEKKLYFFLVRKQHKHMPTVKVTFASSIKKIQKIIATFPVGSSFNVTFLISLF